MKNYKIQILIILVLAASYCTLAQSGTPQGTNRANQSDPLSVLDAIQNGISAGEVTLLAPYLSDQTYFSFLSGVNGYYSVNQSFYVLQDFFNIYRPVTFKFNNIKAGKSPYATGVLLYESRHKRDNAQVYISLEKLGNDWKIAQITIK